MALGGLIVTTLFTTLTYITAVSVGVPAPKADKCVRPNSTVIVLTNIILKPA